MPVLSTLGAAIANVYGFTSGLIKDTYFNLVSLLLPGNGTNGAQNNTFLDGSSNNFTITRNGDTTQGTFSPFSQTGWGAYFDGSNDYVATSANNLSMQFGTGSYTVECWIYQTARNSNGAFFIGGSGSIFQVSINATGYLESSLAGVGSFTASTSTVPLNSWTHIALVRSSTSTNGCTYYINGNASGTYTDSNNHSSSTSTINIGTTNAGSSTYVLSGYISNMRIAKSAYYTSNFTPSITPLTTTSQGATNVTLLSLQNNRFIDNAATPNTLTANNGVAITPFSPFAPTSSYSAAAVGGSGYFDGSGDYLTAPTGQTPLTIGTSSFTISFWFYCPAQVQTNGTLFASNASVTYTNAILSQFSSTAATTLELAMGGSIIKTGIAVVPNQWNFVVIQRTAPSTMQMWVNGNEVTGVTASSANLTDNDWRVAYWFVNAHSLTGYISNFRIVKGTALYSGSTITVPTAPLGSTGSDTSLLLNFTNAGVVDATAKNVLETVGNAQISTAQSKWGGGSIYFASASNSNLLGNTPSNWTFLHDGSTWTVEFWLYPTNVSSFQGLIATNGAGSTNIGLSFAINAGAISISFTRGVSGSSASFTSSAVLNANQWNYVGVTFTGSTKTCAFFINGASAGSSSNTGFAYSSSTSTYPPYIGQTGDPSYPYYFNGYIDDLRITRGVARTITANPTAPFPVQ